MDNQQKLLLLSQIKKNVDMLEKEIKSDMIENGECPHQNVTEVTTTRDKDVRRFRCRDCGQIIEKKRGEPFNA